MAKKVYDLNGRRSSKDEGDQAKGSRFLIHVPKSVQEKMKARARKRGMSLDEYMTALIEAERKKEKKEP